MFFVVAVSMSRGKEKNQSSQSIFRTLFGEIPEKDVPTSIFSQSNPFRVNANHICATNHVSEKRKGDKKSEEVDTGKSKKHRKSAGSNTKLGFQENEGSQKMSFEDRDRVSNLDSEFIEVVGGSPGRVFVDEKCENCSVVDGDDTRKKKRKRREIEYEYEERLHGVAKQEETENQRPSSVGGKKRKKMDNSSENMMVEEEVDEEDRLMRTIFVGNLELGVKKKEILKEFSRFGEIESLRLRSIPLEDTKLPRKVAVMKKKINYAVGSAHAYIVFKDEKSVKNSLSHNMHVFGGNHIRVDRACPPKKKLKGYNTPVYDKKRTVFIGNLPFNIKDEEVYQLFLNIKNLESNIEAVRVIRDPQMRICKGIAYVLMKTREAANMVVKKRLILHDRELRLSFARDDYNSSNKRKLWNTPSSTPSSSAPPSLINGASAEKKVKRRMSYEGIRSNKGSTKMRMPQKNTINGRALQQPSPLHFSHSTKPRSKGKRPAVAARKAKSLGLSLTGKKRKPEGSTPGYSSNSSNSSKFKMKKKPRR